MSTSPLSEAAPQIHNDEGEPVAADMTQETLNTADSPTKKPLVRDTGKSFLPVTRVQKILRADKELPMVAKEATHIISVACEEFIKAITKSAHELAEEDQRVIVKHRDLATVVRRMDKFLFLTEIIPWESKRLATEKKTDDKDDEKEPVVGPLDRFVANRRQASQRLEEHTANDTGENPALDPEPEMQNRRLIDRTLRYSQISEDEEA